MSIRSGVVVACAFGLLGVGCEQRPRRLSLRDEPATSNGSASVAASASSNAATPAPSSSSSIAPASSSSAAAAASAATSASTTTSVPQVHYGQVTLAGTLSEQTFYGPPGYGADPAHDAKEPTLVLQLLTPVDVVRTDADDDWNEDRIGVKRVSITGTKDPALDLHKEIGHPVKLKGKLFGAHSPQHHTDVLMSDVELVPE